MKTRLFLPLSSLLLALALLMQPWQASAAPHFSTNDLVFDFTENAALALWKSGAGTLPFPGTSGDYRGYAIKLDAPVQEDATLGLPGLLTVPHNKYDGYIQGIYPEFAVQKGDRFKVTVGCEYGAKNCYVTYRLDYINAGGATRILWTWKEKYEGRTYSADVDLSSLAGQKVRFVLTMLATGYAAEDRPLWVAPRIVRPGNGLTPMPTLTPTPTPFVTPPPVPPPGRDRASFVADVTVRDGTSFAPGQAFTKTWRLKNSGASAWSKDYALIFYGGEQMGAPTLVNLPWAVPPGAMVDVTINAVAPTAPGLHRGDWMLRNAAGNLFGIGANADKPFWAMINVVGAPPVAVSGYDFFDNLCAAQWQSGAGQLSCPFTDGDSRGYALAQPTRLEDGTTLAKAILTHPQNKYDGYIQGTFPTFTVQPGDRFQAVVGCEHNVSCYVTFRLEYLTAGGAPRIFWKWAEMNEGRTYRVDLDLSPLAGQSLRFVLTTLATGPATNDRAVWGEPRIVRPGIPPVITETPPPPGGDPGTVVSAPQIGALYMLDASHGWATGSNYVLRTTDGGLTWRNVLPDVVPGGAYLASASNGWVIGSSGILYRTSDGGHNWAQYSVPFTGGFLQFLDSQNGFALTGGPIGMHKHPVALYRTSDGGATWTLKYANSPEGLNETLPVSGLKYGMSFRDASTGWVGGYVPMDSYFYLYRTTDGGLTWAQQPLAFPPGYETVSVTTTAPKFFDALHGVLPVQLSRLKAMTRDLFLYTTQDGGNTWQPSAQAVPYAEATDIVSANAAISWGQNHLFYVTENAGSSWRTLSPVANFGDALRALDFVSLSTGWLIPASDNGSTSLYRSTDGGQTWTLLFGSPLPPTETPTEPPTETPEPVFTSPYAAVGLRFEETLNVYAEPNAGSAIVGGFPVEAHNLERGVNLVTVDGEQWVEARQPGGSSGWVRDRNLTEYVAPTQFTADARTVQLIEALKQAVNASDGNLLASLVNPKRGLQIYYHGTYGSNIIIYSIEQARFVFSSAEVINWGSEGASGVDAVGTFAEKVQPKLQDTLDSAYQLLPNQVSYASMYLEPWPEGYQNINYYAVVKPASEEVFDWRVWLAGIEYIGGKPYLTALLHYVWEP